MSPFFWGQFYGQKLLVTDIIISLLEGETFRKECTWV